jgi:hypothetical protein
VRQFKGRLVAIVRALGILLASACNRSIFVAGFRRNCSRLSVKRSLGRDRVGRRILGSGHKGNGV